MSSTDKEKAVEKSGRKKSRKSRKVDVAQIAPTDQQQAVEELVDAAMAATERSTADAAATAATSPTEPPPPAETQRFAEAASARATVEDSATAETPPVGLQTIAAAYRDYTRKSLEDARSYVETLAGVHSIGRAVEVQTEFAKRACETFAADSRKIRDLYAELFRQTLRLPTSPFDRTRER